tara:strand:+ start:1951 stop:2508 length:558 start_codon:yes stop_codon:yes gene_type:complete
MLNNYLVEHLKVLKSLKKLEPVIKKAIKVSVDSLKKEGKLIFAGNGGSAADAQHLASEFVGRFVNDRKPISALALTTDSSALTSIANDYNFEHVFSRQIIALGLTKDVFFCISTSGNSKNLISAAKAAKSRGIFIIGLLGRDGGLLKSMCDLSIIVDSDNTANIQEAHIFIGHVMCSEIEARLSD